MVFAQRIRALGVRLNVENLTDSKYEWTQTLGTVETQRLFNTGRTIALSFSYNLF